jgi:putative protease
MVLSEGLKSNVIYATVHVQGVGIVSNTHGKEFPMEVEIGKVKHYFNHINVAVLNLSDSLKLGDKIHIVGHSTDLVERVASMEVEHHPVEWVKPGDDVAIKVTEPVHEHDVVFLVSEESTEPHHV